MEGRELVCFQIISNVGTSRSLYIEAINDAKEKKFDDAKLKVQEAEGLYNDGHKLHAQVIQEEASGTNCDISLLLVHAEDLLMSAETLGIVANELISIYSTLLK